MNYYWNDDEGIHITAVDVKGFPFSLGVNRIILLEVLLKPGDPYCGHFVS